MMQFVLTRLAGAIATLVVAALLIFMTLDWLPGNPARFLLGVNASPDAVAALEVQLGLDAPGWQRFLGWLGGVLTGNFGLSISLGQPVGALIGSRLAVTLPLILLAIIVAAAIGVPTGVLAARRQGSTIDIVLSTLVRLGGAIPQFWLGILLVLLFAVALRWVPAGGFVAWGANPLAALGSLILPALALALPQAALLARTTREALVNVQDSGFIRTARATGLTRREAVWRHGMRNALLAVLGGLGLQLAALAGASIVVETVFYLPGLGRLIFDAAAARDLLLVRSGLLVLVAILIGTMFLVTLAQAWADPRLRRRSGP